MGLCAEGLFALLVEQQDGAGGGAGIRREGLFHLPIRAGGGAVRDGRRGQIRGARERCPEWQDE